MTQTQTRRYGPDSSLTVTRPAYTGHGDRILEATFFPGSDGSVDAWVVLCDIGLRNDIHPYVVWWMRDDDHETFTGDYCASLREALDVYEARAGKKG